MAIERKTSSPSCWEQKTHEEGAYTSLHATAGSKLAQVSMMQIPERNELQCKFLCCAAAQSKFKPENKSHANSNGWTMRQEVDSTPERLSQVRQAGFTSFSSHFLWRKEFLKGEKLKWGCRRGGLLLGDPRDARAIRSLQVWWICGWKRGNSSAASG